MGRAPDVLKQLATDFNVTNNVAFLPHRRLVPAQANDVGPRVTIGAVEFLVTALLTFCNCYVSVFMAALACPVPPMKANDQLKWFTSPEGKMAGWFVVNRALAVQRAALGYPTVVAVFEAGHGHIAVMMPPPATDPEGAYVSAAGLENFIFDKLERSFGTAAGQCQFFTHN